MIWSFGYFTLQSQLMCILKFLVNFKLIYHNLNKTEISYHIKILFDLMVKMTENIPSRYVRWA